MTINALQNVLELRFVLRNMDQYVDQITSLMKIYVRLNVQMLHLQ